MRSPLAKTVCRLLGLFLCGGGSLTAAAQVPFGEVVAELPYAGSMIADPLRPRMYLIQRADDVVLSIDTTNLTVAGALPTGDDPFDLAISPEGDRLYVANRDVNETVDLIGLDDFVEYTSFAVRGGAMRIAAGVDNRVFVSLFSQGNTLYQIDGITGEAQASYQLSEYGRAFDQMRTTPDGKSLLVSVVAVAGGGNGGALEKFDISGETAVQAGDSYPTWGNLAISHDGATVGVGMFRNFQLPDPAYSSLLPTSDLTVSWGSYGTPGLAGPLAFSGDDQAIYQLTEGSNTVSVYDANTLELLDTLPLPPVVAGSTDTVASTVAVDQTGSYLFVGYGGTDPSGNGVGHTLVIGTGRGNGLPVAPVNVSVRAAQDNVVAGSGGFASFVLRRTGDLSQPLSVAYKLGGSAKNGVDYRRLPLKRVIPAGRASVVIRVSPVEDIGPEAKTVTLTMERKFGYSAPRKPQATVTIAPHE